MLIFVFFFRSLEKLEDFSIRGDDLSPIKHIYLRNPKLSVDDKQIYLQKIADHCADNGMILSVATYLRDSEIKCPDPSIRLASNRLLTQEKIDKLSRLLSEGYRLLKI